VSAKWVFAAVGALALLAGTALWLVSRPPGPAPAVGVAPGALYAASFSDRDGRAQSLGQFQGKIVVLNFWATWCAPCREEMPAFSRAQTRWAAQNVQFVGLSGEEPIRVAKFGRELAITYPLWTGGDGVGELSRRLGNRLGVLPHTVIFGPDGRVLDQRVGPYSEKELDERLAVFSAKNP
jgi:thiol-disulfide isomerase/thioredoxin